MTDMDNVEFVLRSAQRLKKQNLARQLYRRDVAAANPDYSYYQENERQSVDRGGTLEERRHQRQLFHRHVRCSAR